jgi:hypothetical protein
MFEELEEEERGEKEETKKLFRITTIIVGVLAILAAALYVTSRGRYKAAAPAHPAVAARQSSPDPIHDLKVVRAQMRKDVTGIRVMWAVELQNKSAVYTYSDIQYEARFIGFDGKLRATTRDTIKDSIAPGEQKNIPEFIDGFYDSNAQTYQFVLVSAKSTAQ